MHLMDVFVGDNEKDRDLIQEHIFKNWSLVDLTLTSKEYYDLVIKSLPVHLHEAAYKIIFNWIDEIWPMPGMEELIKELKLEKYKQLILISNMPDTFVDKHKEVLPLLNYFDDCIFSFAVKMEKPNNDIFEYVLNKFNIDPKDALFIDDRMENINTAASLGIDTFLFDPKDSQKFIDFVHNNE